ncbi:MAG: acetate--CoA ligase family protein [Xanthomonadales bacterium]|nr:acetate--CoA ligase family protein [Xanthomonadales bacterium]
MTHRLDPLLRPRSIAVMGATERAHAVGRLAIENLQHGDFSGPVYPINPQRDKVLGLSCYPHFSALPEVAEHAIFCVSDARVESALEAAIEHGCKAITIMSQLLLEDDRELAQRVARRIEEADLLLCGPNGMGFYNAHDGVWVSGFDTRNNHRRGGNVTLITHSGAGMCGIVDCEERIDFNLAVSAGQEMNVGMADYMDFAMEQHDPAVIGLFMETARDPEALSAALAKAQRRKIPVLALKVGRTELAARMAQSHSGAMAGEDAAYAALFDRYGVQRVKDMDELATALILFAQPHPLGPGSLVTLHDSGGERQLLIDLADELGTPLAKLTDRSEQALERLLDPGLPAINPLDGWGAGGSDADQTMAACMSVLLADPNAALGAVVHDRAPHGAIYPSYVDYMRAAHAATGKPICLVANRQGTGSDPQVLAATREGFPVLDGLRPFLRAVRALLDWRDFQARPADPAPTLEPTQIATARARLASKTGLDEYESLRWLGDLGLPCSAGILVETEAEALQAAAEFDGPVALKTAMPAQAHKSEQRGVHLGLGEASSVSQAWNDLNLRLGPRALVAPMAPAGVEMVLGMVRDSQFGPLVMLGFGGIGIEAMKDTVFALPPFGEATALRLLDQLQQRPLLDLARGQKPPDVAAFARMAAHFSALVAALGDQLAEIDMNPVIVHGDGCVAVDALVLTRTGHDTTTRRKSA